MGDWWAGWWLARSSPPSLGGWVVVAGVRGRPAGCWLLGGSSCARGGGRRGRAGLVFLEECIEAEISHTELNDLMSEWNEPVYVCLSRREDVDSRRNSPSLPQVWCQPIISRSCGTQEISFLRRKSCCTMVHSVLKYFLTFLCIVLAVPKHRVNTQPLVPALHREDSKNTTSSITTTMSLHTTRSNKKSYNDGRIRKHQGPNDDMSDKDVTLCWTNAALRECTEVSITRILYTNLKQHHVPNLAECFCVTEGYDIFESESNEPLFTDGTIHDDGQLHVVRKYTGNPLPHLDISFPDDSNDGGDSLEEELGAVCWPNPLLGECKEAEIPYTELNELISAWNGDDFLLDACTCASQGFSTAIKSNAADAARNSPSSRREGYTGVVQTYVMTPRVTLCYFDGTSPEYGVWETGDGREVQKGVFCKQVTIDRRQYKPRVIKRFSDADVYECKGGCAQMGYSILMESASRQVATLRPVKNGKQGGALLLISDYSRRKKTKPGEWEYTYHTTDYNPRVTLCYFDGEEVQDSSGTLWWNTNDGAAVSKRELCKQVTISRDLYVSTSMAPGRKERFNKYGIYECGDGGCAEMGYNVFLKSKEQQNIFTKEDTLVNGGEVPTGEAPPPPTKKRKSSRNKEESGRSSGKLTGFPLVHRSSRGDRQARERVDTYAPNKKLDVVR